jgi:hypothetical protein
LPIVAGSATVNDGKVLEVVCSWIAAMASLEGSEGVSDGACSLPIVTTLFSIRHRHSSVRPIPCLLRATKATSAHLGAQLLPGNASDSPQTR